ncbi:MAG: SMC family ATPase, partial [Actinomycetota bacterium]
TSALEIRDAERGGTIAEKTEETERFLRQHLGLEGTNVDLESVFANVVGVPQGRLIADFLERPADRKVKFDPLLGTQDYRAAFDELLEPLNHLQDKLAGLGEERAALEVHVAAVPKVAEAIDTASKGLVEVASGIEAVTAAIEGATAMVVALEQGEKAVTDASAAATRSTQALETAEQRHRLAGIEEQAAASAQKQAEDLQPDFAAFERVERNLGSAREQQQLFQTMTAEMNTQRTEIATVEARLARTRTSLEELLKHEADLPQLESAVKEQAALEEKLQATQLKLVQAERDARDEADSQSALKGLRDRLRTQEDLNRQALAGKDLAGRAAELQAITSGIEAQLGHFEIDEPAAAALAAEIDGLDQAIPGERERLAELSSETGTPANFTVELAAVTELAITRGSRVLELLNSQLSSVDPTRQARLTQELAELTGELTRAREAQRLLHAAEAGEIAAIDLGKRISEAEADVEAAGKARQAVPEARAEEREFSKSLCELGTPTPRDRLTRARAHLEDKPGLIKSVADDEASITTARKKAEELTLAIKPLAKAARLVADLATRLAELQPQRDAYVAAVAVARGLPERRAQLAEAEANVGVARQDLTAARAALQIAETAFDTADLAGAREHKGKLQGERGALLTRKEQLERSSAELDVRLKKLLEHEYALARTNATIARTGYVRRILSLLRNSLRDAGPEVTRTLLSSITATANDIYGEIMGDYSQLLKLDAEYSVIVETIGHERAFAQLSGGEQIVAAMAVRLAMLRELLRIDMAFLDEPTQNLDQERRENLAEQIRRIRGFSQIVVVSHDDTFERLLQSVVHVEKEDGISRVT